MNLKTLCVTAAVAVLACAGVSRAEEAYVKSGKIAVGGGLSYIDVAADGTVYTAGDSVKMFAPDRQLVREWTVPAFKVQAVAVDAKGNVYAAGMGRIKGEKNPVGLLITLGLDKEGKPAVLDTKKMNAAIKGVSSLKAADGVVYWGESNPGRCIHKVNAADGKYLGKVNCQISTCCGILDFDLDGKGNAVVANLGQHRVTTTAVDSMVATAKSWGESGDTAEKFCGCCNPVSVAILPDGKIATSEKTDTRIKVYSADGSQMLACLPAKELGTSCDSLGIAADAKGNIYVCDEQSKAVVILSPAAAAAPAPAAAK